MAAPTRTIAPAGAGGGVAGTWLFIAAFGVQVAASIALWIAGGVLEAWWAHSHAAATWAPGPFSLLLALDMARHSSQHFATQWPHTDPAHLYTLAAVLLVLLVAPIALAMLSFVRGARRPSDPGRLMARGADVAHLTRLHLAREVPRLRPSLTGRKLKDLPGPAVGWQLGRLQPGAGLLRGSWEDVALAFMAPRSGKTTAFAVPQLLEAPGAVVATSNKPDLLAATAELRSRTTGERVWVFDPQSIGRVAQTWWWNPLRAVVNVEEADRLAGHFVGTVEDGSKRDIWGPAGRELLSGLLLAAAVSGGTMRDVYRWVNDETSPLPAQLLREAGYPVIASALDSTRHRAEETRTSVFFTAQTAVSCLRNDAIMAWVNPPAAGSGIEEFHASTLPGSRQTLYLLSKDGGGSAAPLVTALTDRVLREAVQAAERSPGGRLDAPLLALLDEAANICRIGDLPQLYSHFGSRGIVLITILQSYPQGVGVWGESGMKALFGAATIKVIGSGTDDPSFAEDISRLLGDVDVDVISVSSGDGKRSRSRSVQQRRILSAAEIRALPKGRVIVLSTGAKPALLHAAPWYSGPRKDEITAALARSNAEIETASLEGRQARIPDPAWLTRTVDAATASAAW